MKMNEMSRFEIVPYPRPFRPPFIPLHSTPLHLSLNSAVANSDKPTLAQSPVSLRATRATQSEMKMNEMKRTSGE